MNETIIELTESMREVESNPESLSIQNGNINPLWEWWASVVLGALITLALTLFLGAFTGCAASIRIEPINIGSSDSDELMPWDKAELQEELDKGKY